ncbi:hypothetical protein K7432_001170 [Basidiobolus ranarum]|uniref:HMG box domain-containing protein n=1 Tax=Basidiobolus ranarum TaxID=34480 RepID=A0ABR2WA05_9FUNG
MKTQQVYTANDYAPKNLTTQPHPSHVPAMSYHPSLPDNIHFGMYPNPYSVQDVYYHPQQPHPHDPFYANYSNMINTPQAQHFVTPGSETSFDTSSVHSEQQETEEIPSETKKVKIPRPANCFFLFRRDKQSEIFASNAGITNMEVSRIIGKMWKNISVEEKRKYQWMAEKIKIDHQQKYPDYKYSPNRTKSKRKQSPALELEGSIEGSPLKRQNCGEMMDPTMKSYFIPPTGPHDLMNPYFPVSTLNKSSPYYSSYETASNVNGSNLSRKGFGVEGMGVNEFSNIVGEEYTPLPPVTMPDTTGFDFKWLLEEDTWLHSSTNPNSASTNSSPNLFYNTQEDECRPSLERKS